jgi:hypothetical protein
VDLNADRQASFASNALLLCNLKAERDIVDDVDSDRRC